VETCLPKWLGHIHIEASHDEPIEFGSQMQLNSNFFNCSLYDSERVESCILCLHDTGTSTFYILSDGKCNEMRCV
jgi:hypothetical protein